ncbi:BON domain-containing protein [Solirubrobacter sp. CPCC 204708]|uniref:BON domain-containing protein n=1 Tax=Solirubrobacter deserti TaxID=2282478 RepID=A0ABT4RVC3_9ACTN|nr:BON domain-containing protein [Solirubrobacter deserti]MBE2320039.1 BON domain-containing protein [Solirubrobacter deserti]MDA0142537.1 BON domain-containing protein [Solirubrobacter deserti]
MRTGALLVMGAGAAAAVAGYLSRNKARGLAGPAKGMAHGVIPHRREDMDDQTLADRVRSEIFRPADAPKGDVSVDVQAGVVYLRGTVADEAWIERFGTEARKVQGINGVKNLLHAPGTPTPTAEPRGLAAEKHS